MVCERRKFVGRSGSCVGLGARNLSARVQASLIIEFRPRMRERVSLRPRQEPTPDKRDDLAAFYDPASVEAFESHGIRAYLRSLGIWVLASVTLARRPYLRADHSSGADQVGLRSTHTV